MRVVRSVTRLAAEMLCLERGARAFGPDLAPLPPPHAPWPVVPMRPVTTQGAASAVHYRPSVGVVYYVPGADFSVADVARQAGELLDAADSASAHLRDFRAVGATPSTVFRAQLRVASRPGHVIITTAHIGRSHCRIGRGGEMHSRLLLLVTEEDEPPPRHYSAQAVFTWVFMPVAAALRASAAAGNKNVFRSVAFLNASLAGLVYDDAGLVRHAEGADVAYVTPEDFRLASCAEAAWPWVGDGALVVDPAGAGVTYVGRHSALHDRPFRDLAGLPRVPWVPEDAIRDERPGVRRDDITAPEGAFCCVGCDTPLGGEIVVFHPHTLREVPSGEEKGPPGPGQDAPEDRKVFGLCVPCWSDLESPACLADHVGATVARTVLPYTTARACAAHRGYASLAPLLEGRASPVPGAPGAYVVKTGAGDGARAVVIAAEDLGRYPGIMCPAISRLGLPVLARLRIAERCTDWAGPPGPA